MPMNTSLFSKVGYLQYNIELGNPQANLERVISLVEMLAPPPGCLLVLPELWAYGFDYARSLELAKKTSYLLEQLAVIATEKNIYFAGSLLEIEQDAVDPFNTLFLLGPEGLCGSNRKQHLFGFWKEDKYFQAGDTPRPITTPFGLVGTLVCYDLRFPVLANVSAFQGAHLLIVSAEWPLARVKQWEILLQARAIENQMYVVACNSIGMTGKIDFGGASMVIGPDGTVLKKAGVNEEVGLVSLSSDEIDSLRNRFCTVGERPSYGNENKIILGVPILKNKVREIKKLGSKIVFTNGCFDILHSGHVHYLQEARKRGDCLLVGLNSDGSVRSLKGDGRPVNAEMDRARVLAALECVDFVIIFDQDTPQELIVELMPDVLVKGSDWPENKIVGASEVKGEGGEVVRIDFKHDISTTKVLRKIQQNK